MKHSAPYGFPLVPALLAILILAAPAAALDEITDFGENPGNLAMFLHRPAAAAPGLPLVVALHGCTQSAAAFDDETGLAALSEQVPFLLLLPEQRPENMGRNCFRWYDSRDNRPGLGESASILAMIDHAIATESADPARVYVLGLSAGGAMSAVMLANYPSRFAGGAVIAGLPYGCNRPAGFFDFTWNALHFNPFAQDGADASFACGIVGFSATDRDPEDWAGFVTGVAEDVPDQWPPVSLWHGTGDETVDPDNLREEVEQWTAVRGIDAVPDETETVGGATREVYTDDAGTPQVEAWSLPDFPHAVPVDPDNAAQACGFEAPFITDGDICAVRRIMAFWGLI